MRFNRKALELSVFICLVVAMTTWSGSGSWPWVHAAEAAGAVVILLSLVGFMRHGQRTRGSNLPTPGRS